MDLIFLLSPDLLTIDHHTPTPEPVTYDKTDGQWYTHDGVDVKETQQRRGTVLNRTVVFVSSINSPFCLLRPSFTLNIIFKGKVPGSGGEGQPVLPWYFCNLIVLVLITGWFAYLKESAVSLDEHLCAGSVVAAGGTTTDYLDLAKKGGSHRGIVINKLKDKLN